MTSWISVQQKAVEVSGRHVERLVLMGSDERPWAQWAISQEGLAEDVERTMVALQEQLANGKHRAQLVAYDNRGDQWGAYPLVLAGRNAAAATAAQETRTLQQAGAIAISNLESVIVTQRNAIDYLQKRLEQRDEDVVELSEALQNYLTTNVETELKIREHEERKERLDKLVTSAAPILQTLSQLAGKRLVERANESAAKRKAQKDAQQPKQPTDRARPDGASEPAPPTPDAPGHSAEPGEGNVSRARRSRAKPKPAPKKAPKVVRAKSPRKKPLPRKGRKT